MVLVDHELSNLGLCLDNIHVTSPVRQLGFWITKGPGDRETPWQYPDWPYYVLGIILSWLFFATLHLLGLIDGFGIVLDAL